MFVPIQREKFTVPFFEFTLSILWIHRHRINSFFYECFIVILLVEPSNSDINCNIYRFETAEIAVRFYYNHWNTTDSPIALELLTTHHTNTWTRWKKEILIRGRWIQSFRMFIYHHDTRSYSFRHTHTHTHNTTQHRSERWNEFFRNNYNEWALSCP